jgi:hypothetical protein
MSKTSPQSNANLRKIIIILLAVILAFIGWYFWRRDKAPIVTNNTNQNQGAFEEFQGKVTAINNGCNHDDACSVTVDGKTIITGGGLSVNDQANTYGVVDADLGIGDKVKVKALNKDAALTLQGCSDCYITRGSVRGQ